VSAWTIYAISGACSLGVGLWGLFVHEDWVRKILGANVASSGIFLVLVAMAARVPSGAPDPVPHALVLTGIVVSVSATALGLALARRLREAREANAPEAASAASAEDRAR
jgi:multicomponent Na+:H+ antiporter subunit C